MSSMHAAVLATTNIPVGDHVKRAGLNLDTLWTTAIAVAAVLGTGFFMVRRVTSGVPGKIQVFWELVVGTVSQQVETTLGPKYRQAVPLAVTIFMLVLFADLIEISPGLYHNTDYLPSPTADVNLCYAMGIVVFVITNVASIRARGVGGYFAQFVRKPRLMAPLHIIEELVKPFTLALRLFGNLFAGGIMIALILALPAYFAPVTIFFSVIWKLFDMFIGVIQAFIFALLTLLYYQFAIDTDGH
jgi:F-type H+-transporting ATPase subunit a